MYFIEKKNDRSSNQKKRENNLPRGSNRFLTAHLYIEVNVCMMENKSQQPFAIFLYQVARS
jgi:hypothetical protein